MEFAWPAFDGQVVTSINHVRLGPQSDGGRVLWGNRLTVGKWHYYETDGILTIEFKASTKDEVPPRRHEWSQGDARDLVSLSMQKIEKLERELQLLKTSRCHTRLTHSPMSPPPALRRDSATLRPTRTFVRYQGRKGGNRRKGRQGGKGVKRPWDDSLSAGKELGEEPSPAEVVGKAAPARSMRFKYNPAGFPPISEIAKGRADDDLVLANQVIAESWEELMTPDGEGGWYIDVDRQAIEAMLDDLKHKVIPSLTNKIDIATRTFKRQRAVKSNQKNILLFESMRDLASKIRCAADKLESKAAAGKELSSTVAACLDSDGDDGDHGGQDVNSAEAVGEHVQRVKTECVLDSSQVAASLPVLHGNKQWYENIVSGRENTVYRIATVLTRNMFMHQAVKHVRVTAGSRDKKVSTVMAVESIEETASADYSRKCRVIRIVLGELSLSA